MNLPEKIEQPGAEQGSSAQVFGECLRNQMLIDDSFYFFSPDETTSNRLSAVYEAADRAWTREIKEWDKNLAPNGRVIEMLSENTLFAALAGHILSGGSGCMTSYESFLPIVSSQLDQHLKFLKQSREFKWRPDVSALNILSTSCWQRQDHNGYTHQNPALISSLLTKPSNLANCFFPVDDVAAAAVWDFMSESQNVVNLTTFNKNPQPRWIDIGHARYQLGGGHGCSIFQFASDEDPDIVVASIGDIPTAEALEAIKIVKSKAPEVRIRFVNIAALSYAAIGTTRNKLLPGDFDDIFLRHKPIVINFHGYQETIRAIFSHYANPLRLSIHGYEDQGSTTSPIDELARNHASRYDIAADILERTGHYNYTGELENKIVENAENAHRTGLDK